MARMIRDYTNSAKVNALTSQGERFFMRLMQKCDDFGNYPESIKLLNGSLFPDHEDIRDIDVAHWLDECVKVGVIDRYIVDDKKYIHIPNFGQRMDRAKAKFPQPHESVAAVAREVAGKLPGKFLPELEENSNSKGNSNTNTKRAHVVAENQIDSTNDVPRETKKLSEEPEPLSELWFKNVFSEEHVNICRLNYKHLDIDEQINHFQIKCRSAPDEYRHRDTGQMRLAFQYQLRNSKPKKPDDTTRKPSGVKNPTAKTFGTL